MQCWAYLLQAISLAALLPACAYAGTESIVLTNDDGWAVAQIRAQRDSLVDAGFDVRRVPYRLLRLKTGDSATARARI